MGTFLIILQVVIVLGCLLLGTHYGGVGLGLISGIGLTLLVFFFQLSPGEPPIDVMLTILTVIGCASVLQTIGGLDVMMKYAEKLLRKHPTRVTILAPLTTWFLTVLCGTGHVVYTMFPIIEDISLSKNIRPERPMAVSSVAAQMGITASPVSVAVVSMATILAKEAGITGGRSPSRRSSWSRSPAASSACCLPLSGAFAGARIWTKIPSSRNSYPIP